jgi:hypothetical protein
LNEPQFREWIQAYDWKIEANDIPYLKAQTILALKGYRKSGYEHSGVLENIIGLIGEFIFEGFLNDILRLKEGNDYSWIKRKADYWEKESDQRPYDFMLKGGSKITFEIGTAQPNHRLAMFKDKPHRKKSLYFIQAQVREFLIQDEIDGKWLTLDASKKEVTEMTLQEIEELKPLKSKYVGKATLKGFDEVQRIVNSENSWLYGKKGERFTPTRNAWYKEINSLEPMQNLEDIIRKDLGMPPRQGIKLLYRRFDQKMLS